MFLMDIAGGKIWFLKLSLPFRIPVTMDDGGFYK